MTLPPWRLIRASASGRLRLGSVPVITNVLPASGRLPPSAWTRAQRHGGHADALQVVEEALVLGVVEEVEDAGGDHGTDLGDRFQLLERGCAKRVERRVALGEDLGVAGADVADGQAR